MTRIVAIALFAILFSASTGRALADDKPAAPLSRAEIDERIFKQFRDVINRGATIHNNGDPAGCYRLYQGALIGTTALLDHRPELQAAITKGLRDADQMPDPSEQAFALRKILDTIRSTIKKDQKPAPPAKEPGKDK